MKLFRLIAIFAAASGAVLPLRAELADGVKAIVNDTVITYSQVQESIAPAMATLQQQYAGQPELLQQKLNDLLRDSLEQLVERQLILRSFTTDGYQLPESYVDQMVQDRIRDRYGNRITLMKTLQAQGMTYDQFRRKSANNTSSRPCTPKMFRRKSSSRLTRWKRITSRIPTISRSRTRSNCG